MKKLKGGELAGYVKERQAAEVVRLKAADIQPKLVIISEGQNHVNDVYTRVKRSYGEDIGVTVGLVNTKNPLDSKNTVLKLNEDKSVHAIVVQLPLTEVSETDAVTNVIEPGKDVDGLGKDARYESATATAIMWLLAGYAIELRGKNVVIVGRGKLVGQPLINMLASTGIQPKVLDEYSKDFASTIKRADVLITAAGHPGLIASEIIKPDTVIIDAGTASEAGEVKGDVSDDVYEREDIVITPKRGGLGPLTVSALFDNVLRAVRDKVTP